VNLDINLVDENTQHSIPTQSVVASDHFFFKIAISPIVVKLSGHNTVYGKNDMIKIDATGTYDPDIAGMHYYLPFQFKWKCPSLISDTSCRKKTINSSELNSLHISADSLIKSGIQLNRFYKFGVQVTRQEKLVEKEFWIKIVDTDRVPLIRTLHINSFRGKGTVSE